MTSINLEHDLVHIIPEQILPKNKINTGPTEILIDQQSGLILSVGDPQQIREKVASTKRPVNTVRGEVVMPSMTDAHEHPFPDAISFIMQDVKLHKITDKQTLLEIIKADYERRIDEGETGYMIARGWDSRINLTRTDLDSVAPNLAMFALDPSNHGGVVNSKAFRDVEAALKANKTSPDGHILPDGHLIDGHLTLAKELAVQSVPQERIPDALETILLERLSCGTTAVHDLGLCSAQELQVVVSLKNQWERQRGVPFPISRVFLFPSLSYPSPSGEVRQLLENGTLNERDLSWIGIKIFADGALGSHSACLSHDYTDEPGNKGLLRYRAEDMAPILKEAAALGINQIAVHAIGDQTIRESLITAGLWKKIAERNHLDPSFFRIEHFELPLPCDEVLQEALDQDIWAVLQPNFLLDYNYVDRLGEKRIKQISPHRSIHERGIKTMYGTDRMPASPLFAIWCAVQAFYPNQQLTLEEAIAYFTQTPAQYEQDNRGFIREGQRADLIVADRSLVSIINASSDVLESRLRGQSCQEEIDELINRLHGSIKQVYLGGQLVYVN